MNSMSKEIGQRTKAMWADKEVRDRIISSLKQKAKYYKDNPDEKLKKDIQKEIQQLFKEDL